MRGLPTYPFSRGDERLGVCLIDKRSRGIQNSDLEVMEEPDSGLAVLVTRLPLTSSFMHRQITPA